MFVCLFAALVLWRPLSQCAHPAWLSLACKSRRARVRVRVCACMHACVCVWKSGDNQTSGEKSHESPTRPSVIYRFSIFKWKRKLSQNEASRGLKPTNGSAGGADVSSLVSSPLNPLFSPNISKQTGRTKGSVCLVNRDAFEITSSWNSIRESKQQPFISAALAVPTLVRARLCASTSADLEQIHPIDSGFFRNLGGVALQLQVWSCTVLCVPVPIFFFFFHCPVCSWPEGILVDTAVLLKKQRERERKKKI